MDKQKILTYLIMEQKIDEQVAGRLYQKVTKYDDIRAEFVRWLEARDYNFDEPVTVEGYSAQQIANLAPQLSGIGVYNFLVTLRDNPEFGKKAIADGFPRM